MNTKNYNGITIKRKNAKDLSSALPGQYFDGLVKITRKAKPGPVIFSVTDATITMDAVIKDSNCDVNDVVELRGVISERVGKLQIDIDSIKKSEKNFDDLLEEKAEPQQRNLSINSERLEKLKPYFIPIAKRIRKAVLDNQPILVRHHADADGIMSGLAIEKAVQGLMKDSGINFDYNFMRSPSKAPFYEVLDVFKDVSFTKKIIEAKGQKKPLILVLDNGSTPEDIIAMKLLKSLGFEVIVIDHHNPVILENKKTAVCPYVSLHVNPYMEGYTGEITAGMECYEIARLINEEFENYLFPAISSLGDRSETPEAEQYIEKSGLTKEEIKNMVITIDYLAYQLKFDPGKGIYEEVFKNKEFVKLIIEEVSKGVETQLQSTLPYLRTSQEGKITFSHIDIEKYASRFTYPTPGKIVGIIHDQVKEGKENTVITVGYFSDMMIFRATHPELPVPQLVEELHKEFPEANVEGGGHECAGTIKFMPTKFDEIFQRIKEKIKQKGMINEE